MGEADLSNIDIVVYVLSRLGGYGRKVHTEEIAFESYKLANERFGWRLPKFRKMGFPDKVAVRYALVDAAKEKYGVLVEGPTGAEASTDGWALTPAGATWIKENADRIEKALGHSRPQVLPNDAARFKKNLRGQPLFHKFATGGNLKDESEYSLRDMLNTSPDAPKDVVVAKYERLRTTAELVGDVEIVKFLDACKAAFSDVLGGASVQVVKQETEK